jgi:hypothetical protein
MRNRGIENETYSKVRAVAADLFLYILPVYVLFIFC